jgi:hypothetical protein
VADGARARPAPLPCTTRGRGLTRQRRPLLQSSTQASQITFKEDTPRGRIFPAWTTPAIQHTSYLGLEGDAAGEALELDRIFKHVLSYSSMIVLKFVYRRSDVGAYDVPACPEGAI